MLRVNGYVIRQGAKLARGTTIDGYLSVPDCEALYKNWNKEWPEPLEFSGGNYAITCEMILDVGQVEFTKAFGIKKADQAAAARIWAAAERHGDK